MIAPDDTTFAYLEGRPTRPRARCGSAPLDDWRTLATDDGAAFDKSVTIDASAIAPHVTWGTNPAQVVPIDGARPRPDELRRRRPSARRPAVRSSTWA